MFTKSFVPLFALSIVTTSSFAQRKILPVDEWKQEFCDWFDKKTRIFEILDIQEGENGRKKLKVKVLHNVYTKDTGTDPIWLDEVGYISAKMYGFHWDSGDNQEYSSFYLDPSADGFIASSEVRRSGTNTGATYTVPCQK